MRTGCFSSGRTVATSATGGIIERVPAILQHPHPTGRPSITDANWGGIADAGWADIASAECIKDYVKYRYVKEPYFRWMPQGMFGALEKHVGWHLCLTAEK